MVWVAPVIEYCLRSLWSFVFLLSSFFLGLYGLGDGLSPSPFFVASAFMLYRPSQSILTFHPLIRQVSTRIPIPSAASPYFLLVVLTKATLFRSLFPLIWLVRSWAHSMRRWRLLFEPFTLFIPVWVSFCSPSFLRALWRLPLTIYHSFFWSPGKPRTGLSSAASMGHLVFHYLSSTPLSSAWALGPNGKWAGLWVL